MDYDVIGFAIMTSLVYKSCLGIYKAFFNYTMIAHGNLIFRHISILLISVLEAIRDFGPPKNKVEFKKKLQEHAF